MLKWIISYILSSLLVQINFNQVEPAHTVLETIVSASMFLSPVIFLFEYETIKLHCRKSYLCAFWLSSLIFAIAYSLICFTIFFTTFGFHSVLESILGLMFGYLVVVPVYLTDLCGFGSKFYS